MSTGQRWNQSSPLPSNCRSCFFKSTIVACLNNNGAQYTHQWHMDKVKECLMENSKQLAVGSFIFNKEEANLADSNTKHWIPGTWRRMLLVIFGGDSPHAVSLTVGEVAVSQVLHHLYLNYLRASEVTADKPSFRFRTWRPASQPLCWWSWKPWLCESSCEILRGQGYCTAGYASACGRRSVSWLPHSSPAPCAPAWEISKKLWLTSAQLWLPVVGIWEWTGREKILLSL